MNGDLILLFWAHATGDITTLDKTRVIVKDVIDTLLMPNIIVILYFEKEMGTHFDVTSKQNSVPDSLCV